MKNCKTCYIICMKKQNQRQKLGNAALSRGKLERQSIVCAEVWREVVKSVWAANCPADRALAGSLRDRREAGARDRRFYSETVFGFFRFWGMIRTLVTDETAGKIESGKVEKLDSDDEARCLLAANLLAHTPSTLPEAAGLWAKKLGLALPNVYTPESIGQAFGSSAFVVDNALPEWVLGRLDRTLTAEKVLAAMMSRPPLWIRVQTPEVEALCAGLREQGITIIRHPLAENAFAVAETRVNLYTTPEFKRGWFEIQDLASQEIGLVCLPKSGERWWDACAGAGGKALQLAALMERKGSVVATDIREYKLEDLKLRARRSGFPNIRTKGWNGKALRPNERYRFDGVLVDAPCSCSGTWRRNPDGRWTLTIEELKELTDLQLGILNNAASAVKPGGVLIYGTCSLFEEENRGVVERFLAANSGFRLDPFPAPLTGEMTNGMVMADGARHNCDYMFAARFVREGISPGDSDES